MSDFSFESFRRLVLETRSTRRFVYSQPVPAETLRQLVDVARQTSSSRNRQPLKYILVNSCQARDAVFSCLNWAKALNQWGGPSEQERPGGYIIILGDKTVSDNFSVDHGIAAVVMMLAAKTLTLGGCILASADRERLHETLNIPVHLEILLVLALGIPAEEVVLEPMERAEGRPYWRDEAGRHHVPKRSLEEVTFAEFIE